MFTFIGIFGVLVISFVVVVCVFLFVPWLIGMTANAVSGSVTNRPLNLGCLGYVVIAVLGAIVGHILFGSWGPHLEGFYIIPAFIGSLIVSIVLSLLLNRGSRNRY